MGNCIIACGKSVEDMCDVYGILDMNLSIYFSITQYLIYLIRSFIFIRILSLNLILNSNFKFKFDFKFELRPKLRFGLKLTNS